MIHPEFFLRFTKGDKVVRIRMYFRLNCWFVSVMCMNNKEDTLDTFHVCQHDYSFADSLEYFREYVALAEMIVS